MISFEQTQLDVAELKKGQSLMLSLLKNKANSWPEIETPIDIKECSKFIEKKIPTIYGQCQRNEIPFSRKGSRLCFFKTKIIDWLKESEVRTLAEIEAKENAYLSNKKGLK